ncbi:MAG: AraC family transcriptional regulator [Firmicutes bacterium]|nr:AraC family transcriptional regulator [Bacillota bacterium]
MKREVRTVCYDEELGLVAYRFEGITQPFPNHFHNYYVIGAIERGNRRLLCRDREYTIKEGDVLLFNPEDNHSCIQSCGETFDYRALNLSKERMRELAEELTGSSELPGFSQNVIHDAEIRRHFGLLHRMIMDGSQEFEKEELLFLLTAALMQEYGQPFAQCREAGRGEIERACRFMEEHFQEQIALEQICSCSGLSKSTLLRAFTKEKGVTPYRYLQTFRINRAKELLEKGAAPAQAAFQTGFSDQSHFSNSFHKFIGLSPAAYGRIFRRKREGAGYGA